MNELRQLIQQWIDLQAYYEDTYGECHMWKGTIRCYGEWPNIVMANDIFLIENKIVDLLEEKKKGIAIYNGYAFMVCGANLLTFKT